MIIKKQGEAAGSVSEAVVLSNHAEKLFTDFLGQADVDMLPTKRREESLSTLKRLGVVTEVEANTIAAILARARQDAGRHEYYCLRDRRSTE